MLSLVAGTAVCAQPVRAADISWVGYQAGPPDIYRNSASWFHGDQWFNYVVPGASDNAIFDATFDPQGNGTPRNVYFGDFFVAPQPPVIPFPGFTVPGGDAMVDRLYVRRGDFTFHFTSASRNASSLSTRNQMIIADQDDATASLTIRDGTLTTGSVTHIAPGERSTGAVVVAGESARWVHNSYIDLGWVGDGLLKVEQHGRADVQGSILAGIRNNAVGRLEVLTGGQVNVRDGISIGIGHESTGSARGYLTIDGAGSSASAHGIGIGGISSGAGEVRNGGALVAREGDIFLDGGSTLGLASSLRVLDLGSSARANHGLRLWSDRSATLASVEDRATLEADYASIQVAPGSTQESRLRANTLGLARFARSIELNERDGEAILDASGGGRVEIGTVTTPVAASQIRVGTGGSIFGTGTLIGEVVVESGGTISPGLSPGVLDITGSMALSQGSSLFMEIGGTTPGTFDQLLVTGNASLGGSLVLDFINGYTPMPGTLFELLSASGAVTGQFDSLDIRGINPSLVSVDTVDGSLYVRVVPTPGVASLVGLGVLMAASRRRRAAA